MNQNKTPEVRQIVSLLRRWLWLILLCAGLSAAVTWFVQDREPETYEATATIIVELAYDSFASQYNALIAGERLALTYSEMIRSPQVLESAILASGIDISQELLHESLKVEPVRETQLIRLTVRHSSPETAMVLANRVAEQFADHVRELQDLRFGSRPRELEDHASALQASVEETQARFDEANIKLIQNQMEITRMQGLLSQLVQLGTTRSDDLQVLVMAKQLVDRSMHEAQATPPALPTEMASPVDEEQSVMPDLIQQVQSKIDRLASEGAVVGSQVAELELLLGEYRSELRTTQRDLDQAKLMVTQGADRIVVAQPAVRPEDPIGHRAINVTLAAIVGALLASAVVFLQEYLDDTITDSSDARDALRGPLLGSVGRLPKDARVISAKKHGATATDEAYRILASKIRYSAHGGSLKTLQITSPGPGDGKSTTVANLAVALAETGLSVIAVDADLRHPKLHILYGIEANKGFANSVRDGRTAPFLRPTPYERVRLLTCGTDVGEPSEVVSSCRLPEVLDELASEAAIVLVDSPPILEVADSAILASQVDGVVLVLRAGRTRRQAIVDAVDCVQQVGGNLIGYVLNDVTVDSPANYRHRAETPKSDSAVDAVTGSVTIWGTKNAPAGGPEAR